MALKSLPGDGGGFNAGFDTSGGDQLWQAKTVSPSQKGVYENKPFGLFSPSTWGGGATKLTPGGKDVNRAVQAWQNWRTTNDPIYGNVEDLDIGTQKHIYKENLLRDFETTYPGASGLGMTADDVYKQQLLGEEASEDYRWLAGGGIASLENRPKMFLGGGLGIGALLGAGLLGKLFGRGGKSRRKEIKSTLKDAPVFKIPRPFLDEEELPAHGLLDAELFDNQLALGRADGGQVNRPGYDWGGAVGLEPGITSMMGYAKGGMVTKWESKWG